MAFVPSNAATAARTVGRRGHQHGRHLLRGCRRAGLARGHAVDEGQELVLGDLEDAAQLGHRMAMLVDADVEIGILLACRRP